MGLLGGEGEGSSSEEDGEGSGSEVLHDLAEQIALQAVGVLQQSSQVRLPACMSPPAHSIMRELRRGGHGMLPNRVFALMCDGAGGRKRVSGAILPRPPQSPQ